jgi:hypothetical protein
MALYEAARVGEGRRQRRSSGPRRGPATVDQPVLSLSKDSGEALARDDDGLLRVALTTISVVIYEGELIVPSAEPCLSR